MDLDALKKSWDMVQGEAFVSQTQQQIADLLHQPSKGPVARMKRNLWWDLTFSMICLSFLSAFYLVHHSGRLWAVSLFFLTWAFLTGIYFFAKAKLLNQMLHPGWQVKQNFEKQLSILQRYIRWYLLAITLFFPLFLLFLYGVMRTNPSVLLTDNGVIFHWLLSGSINTVTGIAAISIITLLSYYTTKWYIYKLYRSHIRKLTDLVKEMNENN
jgi:hypothetical protein